MIACTVKARTPEAEHIYIGLFPSTVTAMRNAYQRFGFNTAVTVTPIHLSEHTP